MSGGTKYVQTELDASEYERLREYASERGLTVKEASREALREWIEHQGRPDPADPAFTVLEALDDLSPADATATDVRMADDLVEEWDGGDAFEFADDPSERMHGDA